MTSKSTGVTETERLLAEFCERSFLKLWSYPNPFKDDGHELCDLLAVFGDQVFIFFDRENQLPEVSDKDPQVLWDRWKRNVVDRQVKTAHGAERYIRSGRPIFLDAKGATPFPFPIPRERAIIHKIIVAHGAMHACKSASADNVYGTLPAQCLFEAIILNLGTTSQTVWRNMAGRLWEVLFVFPR